MLARVVDAQVAAVDYTGGDDLLLAPAHAVARLLARQGMALGDFDLYELHEAFASTVLATLAAWESTEFCRDRLGLDGAAGHDRPGQAERQRAPRWPPGTRSPRPADASSPRSPSCCTSAAPGARGLVSICAAGGQGVVAILEAV